MKLTVERRTDGWWIIHPDPNEIDCGPYHTKAEAEEDRRGLEYYWNNEAPRCT